MQNSLDNNEIYEIRERILNISILFGAVLSCFFFILYLIDHQKHLLNIDVIFSSSVLIVLILTFYLRKKINFTAKTILIFACIISLVLLDSFKLRIFSDNRILILFIVFFAFLAFNLRGTTTKHLISSVVLLFLSIDIHILWINHGSPKLFENIEPWIKSLIVISFVAIVTLLSMHQINFLIKKLIDELKAKNNELNNYREELQALINQRTEDLENTNEELKATNDELYEKNTIINDQNIELKLTMKHLQEAQAQLIQAEKMASLGVLTAGVAHEINNPLNFIMGGYVGLENYFKENGEIEKTHIKTLLDSIKLGIDRSSAIIYGLNQFNRDREELDENTDIHNIIDNCLLMLFNKTKDRIKIEKKYFDKTFRMIGNIGKLHQVFLNILYNAIQAISDKGTISIITSKVKDSIAIEITDTGKGISSQNLTKVMDPFFTTKDPGQGVGLGLSIAYSIIKEHKGQIDITSKENEGTRVKIIIPLLKYK